VRNVQHKEYITKARKELMHVTSNVSKCERVSCFWQAAKEAAELERRRQQEAARAQVQKELKAQEQQKKVG
jgi:hypothetical protein